MDEWDERQAREEITWLKRGIKNLKAELKVEQQRGRELRQELTRLKAMKPSFRTTEEGDLQ